MSEAMMERPDRGRPSSKPAKPDSPAETTETEPRVPGDLEGTGVTKRAEVSQPPQALDSKAKTSAEKDGSQSDAKSAEADRQLTTSARAPDVKGDELALALPTDAPKITTSSQAHTANANQHEVPQQENSGFLLAAQLLADERRELQRVRVDVRDLKEQLKEAQHGRELCERELEHTNKQLELTHRAFSRELNNAKAQLASADVISGIDLQILSAADARERASLADLRQELIKQNQIVEDKRHRRSLEIGREQLNARYKVAMSISAFAAGVTLVVTGFAAPGLFLLGAGLYNVAPRFIGRYFREREKQ